MEDDHTYFVGTLGVWVHNTGNPCDEAFVVFQELIDEGKGFTESYRGAIRWLLDTKGESEGLALLRMHQDDLNKLIENGLKYALA